MLGILLARRALFRRCRFKDFSGQRIVAVMELERLNRQLTQSHHRFLRFLRSHRRHIAERAGDRERSAIPHRDGKGVDFCNLGVRVAGTVPVNVQNDFLIAETLRRHRPLLREFHRNANPGHGAARCLRLIIDDIAGFDLDFLDGHLAEFVFGKKAEPGDGGCSVKQALIQIAGLDDVGGKDRHVGHYGGTDRAIDVVALDRSIGHGYSRRLDAAIAVFHRRLENGFGEFRRSGPFRQTDGKILDDDLAAAFKGIGKADGILAALRDRCPQGLGDRIGVDCPGRRGQQCGGGDRGEDG